MDKVEYRKLVLADPIRHAKKLASQKKYRENNRRKIAAYKKVWQEDKQELFCKTMKDWRESHKDHVKAYRRWRWVTKGE
jgi:hypothetical protein